MSRPAKATRRIRAWAKTIPGLPTYWFYRAAEFLANTLPRPWAYALADAIARSRYKILHHQRKGLVANLSRATGLSIHDPQIHKLGQQAFCHFGEYLVDFLHLTPAKDGFLRAYSRLEGAEHLQAAHRQGKGVILVTAHLGNWELGAAVLSSMGYKISAVALAHRSRQVDRFFTAKRTAWGVEVFHLGTSPRALIEALKKQRVLALVADHDYTGTSFVEVEFLGAPARLPKGPAALSLLTGAPVVVATVLREKRYHYRMDITPPITAARTGDSQKDLVRLSQSIARKLESVIRRHPDQWFMFEPIS